MKKTAIVILNIHSRGISKDIEIPLDITVNDLIIALNATYDLKIDTHDMRKCYLKIENPIALLHGNKLLSEYGIHDCTILNITE